MRRPIETVANALNYLAAFAALSGAVFFMLGLLDVATELQLIQLIGMALLWTLLPYCLAASVDRIAQRTG